MILLIVDRLTCSSRASPFQSGHANPVSASIRRSSACRTRSPMSNGRLEGRPLGLPVALCFLFMIRAFFPVVQIAPRSAPVGYAAEYLIFASSAVSLSCRGMVHQTTVAYFNLLVNRCQGGGDSYGRRSGKKSILMAFASSPPCGRRSPTILTFPESLWTTTSFLSFTI